MQRNPSRSNIGARFSAAASTYSAASKLQDQVARRVLDLVPTTVCATSVLDAGCGPGRLLGLARPRWPDAAWLGVDIAPGMVLTARQAYANDPRAQFVEGDVAAFQADRSFDLVVSSSALQWLQPFAEGVAHVAQLCSPGGMVAMGVMLDGTLGELHAARRSAVPNNPAQGRLPTLDALECAANAIPGARILQLEHASAYYDQACAMDVLRSLHAMGVTGGEVSRGERPLTRGELQALAADYDQHFATPVGVRVTFVLGYLLLEMV
ncbi:MAG: methyltransferase domain-containing protein [Rhodoferax sp.]|nr:methyltransferase domain-containing protein [Rhodoferax sp.]MDP3652621.1 methyltransferase domain-containing protein [Rhodoferax sp.]